MHDGLLLPPRVEEHGRVVSRLLSCARRLLLVIVFEQLLIIVVVTIATLCGLAEKAGDGEHRLCSVCTLNSATSRGICVDFPMSTRHLRLARC